MSPTDTHVAPVVTEHGVPKKYGKNRRDTGIRAIDAVIKYVKEPKTIEASLRGSVIAV